MGIETHFEEEEENGTVEKIIREEVDAISVSVCYPIREPTLLSHIENLS